MIIPTKGELNHLVDLIATWYELDDAIGQIDFEALDNDDEEVPEVTRANDAYQRVDTWFKAYACPTSSSGKWDSAHRQDYFDRGAKLFEKRKDTPVLFCSVEIP